MKNSPKKFFKPRLYIPLCLLFVLSQMSACLFANKNSETASQAHAPKEVVNLDGLSKAYFASGCFWCVEAIYEELRGVKEAISGYSGGKIKNPSYQQVSSGRTRHAEAVEVYYDPAVVSYETLVKVFFASHDPTTPDRQGPDRGPQYRSMIFYQNDSERQIAQAEIDRLTNEGVYAAPIVTEVVPLEIFYIAEDYHQDYERNHPENPYVQKVSIPRLNRFKARFPELLKH